MDDLLTRSRPAAEDEPHPKRQCATDQPEPSQDAATSQEEPSASSSASASASSSSSSSPSVASSSSASSSGSSTAAPTAPPLAPVGLRNDTASVLEREARVGISKFLGSAAGFDGVMKLRYSDFLVNEINEQGEVVRLDDLTSAPPEAKGDNEPEEVPDDEGAVRSGLAAVIGEEQTAEVWRFLKETSEEEQSSARLKLEHVEDKERRTAIHRVFKTLAACSSLPSIFTQTDEGCVVVCFQRNKKANNFSNRWPPSRPQYLWFVLSKENKDTNECVGMLSRMLRKKPAMLQYAGTKDKRGITTQLFSVQKVTAQRMMQVNKGLQPYIATGNYRYEPAPLKLGMLKGNRFTIVLRNVEGDDDDIESSLHDLKNFGFLNYYGMQRFGTGPTSTDSVGLAVLKGDWKEAVEMLLVPGNRSANAIAYFQSTGDAQRAHEMLKKVRGCSIESSLLMGYAKNGPHGHQNAFYQLPRNMRLMYVHGYQSKVWNLMASKRLELFGYKPAVGDLVVLDADTDEDDADALDADAPEEEAVIEKRRDVAVHSLTQADIDSGKYTMLDIVLPLPGHLVTYPENLREFYAKRLSEDGLHIDNLQRANKDYSLTGDYRKIVRRATDVEWKIMRYDELEPLVLSDMDRIKGKPEPQSKPDGEHKAVVVAFTLPSSCYATMALREAMKRSTTFSRTGMPPRPATSSA
eukprot:TRINITY_DN2956_c1_g3_i1.p1 TRINITY_DN2956_c1_g3~~TRINITY_DN2956_c1_g3_i1.p1  ORF type:complete len:773 (+),score=243.69 TRINITY_DN2956_c1_g3_i1:249-2321(+)